MIQKPEPITLAQLPEDWIEERREVIARVGYPVRAHVNGSFNIETQSLQTGEWLLMGLPLNAPGFDSAATRDAVLSMLWRSEPLPKVAKEVAT